MRILIVNDYGTPAGGAEHMSIALRDGLRARGHDARLFASSARPLPIANAADYRCFGSESPLRRVLQATNPAAAISIRRVLAGFRPDVVHVRMFLTQLSPLILPSLRGIPALLHAVNYQTICPLNTRVLPDGSACRFPPGVACARQGCVSTTGLARVLVQQGLWRRWRGVFDRIVANSRWTMERLREQGIDVSDAIWNGVPVVAPRPPLSMPPTIGFAGRLVGKKGVDVLLRALVLVRARVPEARLVLAGDGPDRASVERLIRELGLEGCITRTGHLSRGADLERALSGVWVQAVPSVWDEPFGLAAAEAMMRGTAVVASDRGGLTEIVRHGETGLLVPSADDNALAVALCTLLLDRARAEGMGLAARRIALRELTEERVVERFEALYAELLESARPRSTGAQGSARTNASSRAARAAQE